MQYIFTPEIESDCHEQSKIKSPKTQEERDYNIFLDEKIKKVNNHLYSHCESL